MYLFYPVPYHSPSLMSEEMAKAEIFKYVNYIISRDEMVQLHPNILYSLTQ